MVETAVYDKTIFVAKREGLGIRIKKSKDSEWRTISFPESPHITSFKVINRGSKNDNIVYFNSVPYTSTTGQPSTLSIGADADDDKGRLYQGWSCARFFVHMHIHAHGTCAMCVCAHEKDTKSYMKIFFWGGQSVERPCDLCKIVQNSKFCCT